MKNLSQEAEQFGGNDEIILKTIDLSDEIPVKDWEMWLKEYGNPDKMEYIGKHFFRPVHHFIYGECPLCGEMMRKASSYSYEGIIVAFTCGSYKKGAKHKFVWSKGFAFPMEGANIAFLGALV